MTRLVLFAAILFTFVGRSADAASLFDFTYTETSSVFSLIGPVSASGTFTIDSGTNFLTSASGTVDGSSITDFQGSFNPISGTASINFYTATQFTSFVNTAGVVFEGDHLAAVTGGTFAVSAVPLPASAPLFGLALLALAAVGFASNRLKREPFSPSIVVGNASI
jgi:hypothetical protein